LPTGILQGQLRVYIISSLNILVAVLKIVVGLTLVMLGYQIVGAMIGIVVSLLVAYLIALYVIRKRIVKKTNEDVHEEKLLFDEIKDYGIKFFLATLGIAVFTSMDVILARHFFPPVLAGQYAALSIMGKSIFYLTFPINFIFFPLIAQKKEKKENVTPTLIFATILILIVSVFGSTIYFLYPEIILRIFFPSPDYKSLSIYLGPISIYFLIFSIASLFNSYLLSIGKTQIYKINIFAGVLLTVLIVLFHESLFEVIGMLFISSFLLLILLLLYYWYNGRD
jgi:O-antigen/teichoic acid export membrane protein